jgi:hypothetical protein
MDLGEQTIKIACYYLSYKLGVRLLFGSAEDERGWGNPET